MNYLLVFLAASALLFIARRTQIRLRLSRAKHRSLAGHAKISRLLSRQVPFYEYSCDDAFACDGVSPDVAERRRIAFENLGNELGASCTKTLRQTAELEASVSDLQFTNANRVPFQFRSLVRDNFNIGAFALKTSGPKVCDLDGNWSYDLGGSYGVNLLGHDFYKRCIEKAVSRAGRLGPVLGPYHPVVTENVALIKQISGLDEVSFHMSGTEAVMQAVRLARFHTNKSHLVMSTGAYHGWWDGVQPGIGHQRKTNDIYMLKDLSEATLRVLATRKDIACVLVNPLQALHPNTGASSDAMLVNSSRRANYDKAAYRDWLKSLRTVCDRRGIVLIFDEVFVGFRLGLGGAQEYFGIRADMVTYGKTIGGGLPVGVLAGSAALMKRFHANRPTDLCFARGTFNTHPYVMTAMNEFLRYATGDAFADSIEKAESIWNRRAERMNRELHSRDLPIRVRNLSSIWTLVYERPSRFNWMLQFYLRAENLNLSWVGTGRFIFSHDYTDDDFNSVVNSIVRAATRMHEDGWWSAPEKTSDASISKQVFREILARRLA